ncbi:MAG: hypothetical protein IT439_05525 [Phycisphaerales bacterium]|nr:hypothetical protein [Phycisphaerales bacterium]
MTQPLRAPEPYWQDPGGSPREILSRPPGFRVEVVPGIDQFGPAQIARMELAVADRYDRQYGGKIRGACTLAAIDLERGGVYARSLNSPHAVPLRYAMQIDAAGGPGEGLARTTMAATLNVDLGWMLELPPLRGNYAVFFWIDETLSDVKRVTVESAAKRFSMPAAPARPEAGSIVKFSAATGAAGARLLSCEPARNPWEKRHISGRIALDLLSRPLAGKDPRPVLSILVLDHITRLVGHQSILLPEKPGGNILSFTADIEALLKTMPEAGQGRVFVVAHIDAALSQALVFEAPPRKK